MTAKSTLKSSLAAIVMLGSAILALTMTSAQAQLAPVAG
jgi:hypothetical protein